MFVSCIQSGKRVEETNFLIEHCDKVAEFLYLVCNRLSENKTPEEVKSCIRNAIKTHSNMLRVCLDDEFINEEAEGIYKEMLLVEEQGSD